MRLDQRRIEAHPLGRRIDVSAGVAQHRPGPLVQEVDADLLEHGQRSLVDRLQLIRRNKRDRREGKTRLRLPGAGPGAPRSPPRLRRRGASSPGGALSVIVSSSLYRRRRWKPRAGSRSTSRARRQASRRLARRLTSFRHRRIQNCAPRADQAPTPAGANTRFDPRPTIRRPIRRCPDRRSPWRSRHDIPRRRIPRREPRPP